jgi:transposase InsO family protein
MAIPRPDREQPRRKDIEDLTEQYLCKFEGVNDYSTRIQSTLARSMGAAEAEQLVSGLDHARTLPLGEGTDAPEHVAELEVLENCWQYRVAQGYSKVNQDGKEVVIEIQEPAPGDLFASGDPVKVHNDKSVHPAHARGRVGLVAGYGFDLARHRRVVYVDLGTSTSERGTATCAGVEPQNVSLIHSPITPLRMERGATVRIRDPTRGSEKYGTVTQVVRSRVISTTQVQVTSRKGKAMWVQQSECTVLRSAQANGHTNPHAHSGNGPSPGPLSTQVRAGKTKAADEPGPDEEKAEGKTGGLMPPPLPDKTQDGWIIGDQVNLGGKRGTIDHLHTDETRGRVATVSTVDADPVLAQCAHLERWAGPPAKGDTAGTSYRWPPEIGTVVTVTRSDKTRYYGVIVAADGQEDSPQPLEFTVASVDHGDECVAPDTLSPADQVDESTAAALHGHLRQHDHDANEEGEVGGSRTTGIELSYGMEPATGQGDTLLWPPPAAAHVLYDGHPSTIQARVEGDDKCPIYRITRVSDGRVTQDASVTRMTPGMPFEESHTNGQSRATSLHRKRKGKRDSVARTGMGRWVNTLGMLLSVWHLILGHCHADRVRKTLNEGTIGGRIIAASPTRAEGGDEIPPDGPCEGCQSTQTRTPWAKQSTAVRAEDCFDLLTIDYPGVKGGEHGGLPVSLTGGRIPLFVVDHHSSYCWVFEVPDYSGEEVCKVLEKMDTIARQSGRKIGALGSDSARTFTHGRVPRFCAQLGIRQTYTHTNSSNGNPRCERMIRTIYRAARACLTHSKLPLTCWYHALQYNAAVANVLCSKASSITPHELMYHTVPVMNEHWHVFGSRGAVTHVSKWMIATSKLLPTATPGYFIGQCKHRRGVEMLYMRRGKGGKVVPTIIETRDYVIFNLTTARPRCPEDLVGLQGDPGEEAKALKSLSHTIVRQEPDPETGRTRDVDLKALLAAYLGEPRAAQAEEFIGRTVTNRDPDGQTEINGVVKSTCYNQDLGAVTLPGSPPARLVYQVTWEGGAGEHLTWEALHPLLSAGQLFDKRMEDGCGITCPNGHPVKRTPSTHDAYNCDGCGDAVRIGADQARCPTCDWDICGTCIDGGPYDHRHSPTANAVEEKEGPPGGPHEGEDDDQDAFQTGDAVTLLHQDAQSTKWYGATIERAVATGYHCRYDTGEAEFIRADDAPQRLKYAASPTHPGPTLDRLNETMTTTTATHAVRVTGVPMRCPSARRRQGFLAHDLNPGMQNRTTHVRLFASPPRNETPKGKAKEERTRKTEEETDETKEGKGATEEETRKRAWGDARKRAKEAQAKVAGADPSFNLKNGDAVIHACEHRHRTGERTTVIVAQQDTPKEYDTEGRSVWESMTQPSIDSWLPWLKRNRPEHLLPGTSTTVSESGRTNQAGKTETTAILIGLSNGKRSLSSTRAEEWRRGLADALSRRGEELRGTNVYIQLGTGMKVGGKVWMEKFLPAAASFALEAGRRYGTVTNIVQHVPAEPTKWYDPQNWAGHAGIWSNTREALGMQAEVDHEEETKPGGYAQGERRGAPDVERTLREMETSNVDMLTSTSGLACPTRLDGMYPATTGIDSQVEGKEEFIGDDEAGQVGAPVKFATTQGEHHEYRLNGKYNATAPMLGSGTAGGTDDNFDGGTGTRERRRQADVRDTRKRRERRATERASKREQKRHEKRGGTESGPRQMTDRIKESRVRAVALSEKKSVEMILISANDEEPTYRDALSGPAGAIWYDAVLAELITQFNQSAFRVVPRGSVDKGINVMLSGIRLNVKWTHTTALGLSPKRFKARFVCGGDSQEYLQTYVYVSSPCPRPATVRWLLAKSSDPGWEAYGVDVAGAFCQAPVELPGEMFMEFPRWLAPDDRGADTPDGVPWNQRQDTFNGKGEYQDWENYACHMDPIAGARASSSNAQRRKGDRSDFVLELKRMIYGCKQSARVWHQLWCAFLEDRGFKRSAGDECLWSRVGKDGDALMVCTHVDDTLCVTPNEEEYLRFLEEMRDVFECTDEGGGKSIEFFLGIRIERDEELGTVTLSQEGLHDKILHTADTSNLGSVASTPMLESAHMQPGTERGEINAAVANGGLDLGWKYGDELPDRSREEDSAIAQVPYRRLVGQLIHCVTWTRPDLAYAVSSLARFADPLRTRWAHVRAMARLVEYIRNTKTMGITYRGLKAGEEANVVGFVDADWAGDDADRLSMTSYVMMCRGGAISWQSAKQEIVAQSSFESELIATRAVAAEMLGLIKDFPTIERGKAPTPLVIGCDNAAVCAVSTGGGSYKNRRHIDIRYLLIRETVMKGAVILEPVPTDWNPADLGTKALGEEKFCRFRDYMMNNVERQHEEGAEWMSTKVRPGGVPSRASRIGSAAKDCSAPSRATRPGGAMSGRSDAAW